MIIDDLTYDLNYTPCRLGASITVTTTDTLSALSSLLYNSACFAIYEDPLVAPTEWNNVSTVV